MNLSMTGALAAAYHSGAQRARVVTESWGESNLYCPNCPSPKLSRLPNNTRASDYTCPSCAFRYQLKGQLPPVGKSINDGAFDAMMEAIKTDRTPNFFFMQYELPAWRVKNLLLVPHFAFPPSAIIKRKPLSPTARRAGWVGCNFDLNRIPADARIEIIITRGSSRRRGNETLSKKSNQRFLTSSPTNQTIIIPPKEVRDKFKRVKPLKDLSIKERGWTLDVLNAIRRLGKTEFTTADAYAFARELEQLHPDNRHVKDKIRQQLQVLRDTGLLLHVERGLWRLP